MSAPSPPKPWERPGAGGTSSTTTTTAPALSSDFSSPPALPDRPSSLTSVVNRNASNYSPYNNTRSPYGGYGGMSSYSSPYSRLGGMYGSSPYGMGGMGGMYGSSPYGMGMGGYGGMYGGMGGMGGMNGGDPSDPSSLTQSFSQSTQATFQIIESIVGAFGGFSQMLESTYMATHSSFFAMVAVAEQLTSLRQTLGSVLGIFTLLRWFRTLFSKITGRPPPASSKDLTPANFAAFAGTPLPDGSPAAPPRASKKPFFFFLAMVFGMPYLMGKLIRALARTQEEEEQRRMQANGGTMQQLGPNGQPVLLDPSKLEFCRVLYDYSPPGQTAANPNDPAGQQTADLAAKKGDLVAVLSKLDPQGDPSQWWRCRARDGRMGWLPGPYLEPIQRRGNKADAITAKGEAGSRAQSMTGAGESSRAHTMTTVGSATSGAGQGTRAQTMDEKVLRKKNDDLAGFQTDAFYP